MLKNPSRKIFEYCNAVLNGKLFKTKSVYNKHIQSTAFKDNPNLLVFAKNFITPIEQYHDLAQYSQLKYTLKNGEKLYFSKALLKAIEDIDNVTHYKTTVQEAMDQAEKAYTKDGHQIVKDLHSSSHDNDTVVLINDKTLCEFRTTPMGIHYPAGDIRCIGYKKNNEYFFTEIGRHKDIDQNKIKVIFGIANQYTKEKIDTYVNDIMNKSYLEEFMNEYLHHPTANNDI